MKKTKEIPKQLLEGKGMTGFVELMEEVESLPEEQQEKISLIVQGFIIASNMTKAS